MTLPAIIPAEFFCADDADPLGLSGLTIGVIDGRGTSDVPALEVGITLEVELSLELNDGCSSSSIVPSNTVKAEV